MKAKTLLLAAMAGSLLLPSLEASAAKPAYRVHYSLVAAKHPQLPKRLVILPVAIEVTEKTAGGVTETVDKWSEQASRNIFKALGNYTRGNKTLTLVNTPNFSGHEEAVVNEHLALYKKVVNTASWATSIPPVWNHKLEKFDYTIGSGLDFVRSKTGADTALMVYGEDEVSTAGRQAVNAIGHVPLLGAFVGGPKQMGHSYIHLGLVDLRTGAILWTNREYKGSTGDLRRPKDAQDMVDEIFKKYPGIKEYRAAYVK